MNSWTEFVSERKHLPLLDLVREALIVSGDIVKSGDHEGSRWDVINSSVQAILNQRKPTQLALEIVAAHIRVEWYGDEQAGETQSSSEGHQKGQEEAP